MTLEMIRVAGQHMNVNSYVIRGPDGAVVVDGQLCRDDGERVRQAVAATGLPLAGVVLTHGHPDHYAAIASFASPDIPIVATHGVDAMIRRDDAVRDGIVGPMIGEQWPADRPFPNRIVDSGETVDLGRVRLTVTVTEVGPAESHCDSYWQLDEQTIFTGDRVTRGVAGRGHRGTAAGRRMRRTSQTFGRKDNDRRRRRRGTASPVAIRWCAGCP